MSWIKYLIIWCLFIICFIVLYAFHMKQVREEAYNQGYDEGMAAISPDYCLKEFSKNDKKKFRYIQRQYCRGISK